MLLTGVVRLVRLRVPLVVLLRNTEWCCDDGNFRMM